MAVTADAASLPELLVTTALFAVRVGVLIVRFPEPLLRVKAVVENAPFGAETVSRIKRYFV